MISDQNSSNGDVSPTPSNESIASATGDASWAHPSQLGVLDWQEYSLVIDARSPHEYDEDHVPGAINLPVVGDAEFAEVGTQHRTDTHAAYLIGVEYSLRNIAAQIRPLISKYGPQDRLLVYCFRGGKRSRLWADSLRTIGFEVDVLEGGWKRYRSWVRAGLESLPLAFSYRVLCGPTGCGKTRVLHELTRQGHQVLDLEGLAHHRGSLLGDLPGDPQPTQKLFDSALVELLRHFDPQRPVWIEAESKKVGNVQLPEALFEHMHRGAVINLSAPMSERVKLWREDYPHFAADLPAMVRKLEPLKPLVGKDLLLQWRAMAEAAQVDELFESIMVNHYDPCYGRSTRRSYGAQNSARTVRLQSLDAAAIGDAVREFAGGGAI